MRKTTRFVGLLVMAASTNFADAQSFWSGQGPTLDWSEAANWDGGIPADAANAAFFGDWSTNPGHLTNWVSLSLATPSLTYGSVSNLFTTQIPLGSVLTLGGGIGGGQPLLRVGTMAPVDGSTKVTAVVVGAGELAAPNPQAIIDVRQSSLVGGDYRATLDLSGLNTFTASVYGIWVGAHPVDDGGVGTLLLARTNSVTTAANLFAPGILLGASAAQSSSGEVRLGWMNSFNTDALVVGGNHSGAYPPNLLAFGTGISGGSFQLRGSAGGSSRADLFSIGDATARPDGYSGGPDGDAPNYGTAADFTGGSVDARVNSLVVARSAGDPGTGYGWAYGSLLFNQGVIDASRVDIGLQTGTNYTTAAGAVILSGSAVLNVAGDISMASRPGGPSYSPMASLEVDGNARVNIRGNLVDGGGVSTITLGGGVIDLQPSGDATAGDVSVAELVGQGTLTNAGNIYVRQKLVPGGDFTPGTLALDGNLTLGSSVALNFNLSSNNLPGGLNDYLRVGGNLALSNNPLSLTFGGPLAAGNYHLIDYAGILSGSAVFSNATRLTLSLTLTTPHHLDLSVSGAPGNLVWSGISGSEWDTTSQHWNGDSDVFYTLDNVTFNDAGVARTVSINGNVQPGSITVEGNGDYTLQGYGNITGFTGITKNGAGTLTLAVGSDFRGPVRINGGVLVTARYQALGLAGDGTYIAPGGTLDINGQFMSEIEPVFIAGNGHAGLGAVMNSGGNSLFGLRQLTLTADATVSATSSSWGVSGSVPFDGLVDLAGHTLTKIGSGTFDIYGCNVSNSGNIIVNGGTFRVRQSIVSGPGTLVLGANELAFLNNTATGYVAKAISVNGGRISAEGEAALVPANIAASGSLTVSNNALLTISGAINGAGSLVKDGGAVLELDGANGFGGMTHIRGGQITLGTAGSLAGSSLLQVDPATVLDVSSKPAGYSLASGQALELDGTLAGDLTAASGNTVAGSGAFAGSLRLGGGSTMIVGGDGATLTVNVAGNLSLQGAQCTFELTPANVTGNGVNDLIAVGGDLNLTSLNTLSIRPVGILSGTYTLLTYSGKLTGGAPNITLSTPSRYTLALVDPATTPGEIRVKVTGSAASLVWRGGAAGAVTLWNLNATANWLRGGSASTFLEGDLVTFDDTSVTNLVSMVGSLRPAAITFNNNARAYRLAGDGNLFAANLTNSGNAGLTIDNSADNILTGVGLVLNSGITAFDQPTNAAWTGMLSGTATLAKIGTNTLTYISPGGTNFSGNVSIQGGTLRLGSGNALGSSQVTIAPGARLDLNGQTADACVVQVAGSGPDTSGAINNFGGEQTGAVSNVQLGGDTTLGAAGERWDIVPGTAGGFQGMDKQLTKAGPGQIWIRSGSATGIGDIDVQEGTLVFAGAGTTPGNAAKSITVRSNASLGFGGDFNAGTKPTTIQSGGSLYVTNSGNFYRGTVALGDGLVRMESLADLELSGPLQGPGALRLVSSSYNGGNLVLSGTNAYVGGTIVNVGMLTIANPRSLPPASTVVLTNTGGTLHGRAAGAGNCHERGNERRRGVAHV